MSQTAQDDADSAHSGSIPGDILPGNATAPGPVANVDGHQYKFDEGFYSRIQDLILEDPQEGDFGVYDGERYYNVVMVVSRDDGDGRDGDETASENKEAVVKRLKAVGARDIVAAESLSFVTASIPVADIPGFALDDDVYKIGDGEQKVTLAVDTARETINATPLDLRLAAGRVFDGTGVTVAVVDTGLNHTSLNSKIVDRAYCGVSDACRGQQPSDITHESVSSTHGTQVAGVLAASGMPAHNGIAPGVSLLDAQYSFGNQTQHIANSFHSYVAHALDWSLTRGADVANISAGLPCSNDRHNTFALITNEAVDKGMVVVSGAGNEGTIRVINASEANYHSLRAPGCTHNTITVGGIDDRTPNTITMYNHSSRGPAPDNRLKPEIVAPATDINVIARYHTGNQTVMASGTSYAAPQVSAASAILLEARPELTPAEVKAALLLGANWQGPIPCNSSQYEQSNGTGNCSHLMQPRDHNEANSAASLGILNNVGFGILDVSKSLGYVHTSSNYVISDYLDTGTTSRQYRFVVSDTSDPVKVILTWLVQPHGGIAEQVDRGSLAAQTAGIFPANIANLDFTIAAPDGSTIRAESSHQTNEFAVFTPGRTGTYTITVTGSGLDSLNKPVQNFALASTRQLSFLPSSSNTQPVASPSEHIVSPGMEKVVRLSASDADGDAVSFHVSRDPTKGVITTDEFITKTTSRAVYTPNSNFTGTDTFQITPHDGQQTGTPATVTLRAESLPPGSANVSPSSDNIRDWDTLEVTSGFAHADYSQTFSGPGYTVSAIYVGSVNMEGVDLKLVTTSGTTYTVAIPPSGSRMMELATPISIRSATLSADGVDEEAAHEASRQRNQAESLIYDFRQFLFNYNDVRMFVGYVPSSCSGGASGASGTASCPASATYRSTAESGLTIPDNTGSQDAASTIYVPVNGTSSSLTVSVSITHTYIGDLRVELNSPDGTQATLHGRTGGSTDNISSTYYSSSHTGLRSMTGSAIAGNWTLSVGDYAGGDIGILNDWSLEMEYAAPADTATPEPPAATETVLFLDDFESSDLTTHWTETGDGDWTISTSQSHSAPTLPGRDSENKVLHSDNCDNMCTLTLTTSLDLTDYDSATLGFWRFIDYGLDRDEYLKVEAYDGSTWSTIYHWSHNLGGDDNMWHQESYDLASYLEADDFKIRLVTQQSSSSEDVQLDDITISAASDGSTVQPPSRPATISEDFESGLDGWTQGGDSDWITRSPTTPLPGSQTGNTVAYSSNCDTLCTITLSPVDLSSRQTGHLTLDRFVSSSLDGGEYLRVELHDGSAWTTAFDWQASSGDDDSTWHTESYDLSSGHLVSEMQVRITARSSSSSEITMIDNISISDSGSSPTSGHSIYVADTDDREVLVFSESGTYLGDFVEGRAGGLGKAWDVAFGPDGHLYISDNTYSKIRKYNGATGAPISGSSAGWASTTGYPYGLTWNGNTLYVATSMGVERFSSSGSSLGYFGDASRNPASSGATALLSPYDVVFCTDGRMYAADRSLDKILYYRASDGTYQGAISGTGSSPPNTYRAAGLECGAAMGGTGSSLYQGGDDAGRVNEINPTSGSLITTITSLIDEPYGMDMDDAVVLYVANKDDDNIISISSGTASVFVSGNRMDDPRGVVVGPQYSASSTTTSGSQSTGDTAAQENDGPEFELAFSQNGTAVSSPMTVTSQQLSLVVRASDAEGDPITIGMIPDSMPEGSVSVTDHGNGTAAISLDTTGTAVGTYVFWVTASDLQNHDREPYAVIVP